MLQFVARIGRRVAFGVLSLVLILVISRVLIAMAPGRFGDELRLTPGLAAETLAVGERRSARAPEVATWRGLWRGDLGRSMATGLPVAGLVVERAANTLILTVPATVLAWTLALLVVARRAAHGPRRGVSTRAGVVTLQALPDLVLGMLLLRIAWSTDWFPVGGRGHGLDVVRHATLPVAGLTLGLLPPLVRHLTAVLEGVDRGLLVPAARARGVSQRAVFWRHLLPAMLPGMAPLLALSVAALVGASLVFEVVFDWPGLGALLLEAVLARDLPVITGCVLASAVLLVASNVIGDAVHGFADPRQRV